jgi:hypothetical protein
VSSSGAVSTPLDAPTEQFCSLGDLACAAGSSEGGLVPLMCLRDCNCEDNVARKQAVVEPRPPQRLRNSSRVLRVEITTTSLGNCRIYRNAAFAARPSIEQSKKVSIRHSPLHLPLDSSTVGNRTNGQRLPLAANTTMPPQMALSHQSEWILWRPHLNSMVTVDLHAP